MKKIPERLIELQFATIIENLQELDWEENVYDLADVLDYDTTCWEEKYEHLDLEPSDVNNEVMSRGLTIGYITGYANAMDYDYTKDGYLVKIDDDFICSGFCEGCLHSEDCEGEAD